MKNTGRYDHLMGKRVIVTKHVRALRKKNERKLKIEKYGPVNGWIIGVRYLQEGKMHDDCYEHDTYCRPYFEQTKTMQVVLVTTSPLRKPIHVPMNAFKEIKT